MASHIQYKQVIQAGAGQSNPIRIDLSKFRGGVGLIVTIPAGVTANYSVLVTGDDPTAVGGFVNWNNHDVLNNKTVSANSNLAFPVTGVALLVNSYNDPIPPNNGVVLSVVQVGG